MLDLLLPTRCSGCARPGPRACPACLAGLEPPPSLGPPVGLDSLEAAVAYQGTGAALAAGLKYRGGRRPDRSLVLAMAALVPTAVTGVVTWAPTSPARRRRRGFDPAQALARPVARALGCPSRRLLRRAPGPAQTGRTLAQRTADPPRFSPAGAAPPVVLLVDDVATTGATLASAAAALRAAGARQVHGLVLARTP